MRPRIRLAIATAAACLAIAAVGSAGLAIADQAADPPLAEGRVLFAPRLGGLLGLGGSSCACDRWLPAPRCTCSPSRPDIEGLAPYAGVRAQNLGTRPTRFLAVYFGRVARSDTACTDCTYIGHTCSPVVEPADVFAFPPDWLGTDLVHPVTGTAAASAVVYSLSTRPALEAGPGWADWLAAAGLPSDASMADVACHTFAGAEAAPTPPGATCDAYEAFHAAFLAAEQVNFPGSSLPMSDVPGEPAAGVVTVLTSAHGPENPVLDRYSCVPPSEAGAFGSPAERVWAAPGGYGVTQDGNRSAVTVQNAGTECTQVSVAAHRSHSGPYGTPVTMDVPPGAAVELESSDGWPDLSQMATFRLTADAPIAAALTNRNAATSATLTAVRERVNDTRWLVPRAYQELRRLAAHTTAQGGTGSEGWETNVAIFNPSRAQRDVLMRMQAAGEPARGPIGYPIEAEAQVVLQPGFGLGLPGGPGWMELTSDLPPMAIAVESLRESNGTEGLIIETWATAAWPYEEGVPAPRAFALADLGGPAVGGLAWSDLFTHTATMTDALQARIAIQNPEPRAARVEIDSFAPGCGFVGRLELSIDPRQTATITLDQLPGTAFGANHAVARVLDGNAVASVEIVRPDWMNASPADVPLDLSSAFHAGWSAFALPPTEAVSATLAVTPTELTVTLAQDAAPLQGTVAVSGASAGERCLSVFPASDVPWLRVALLRTRVPGVVAIEIDPAMVSPGQEHVGTVTLVPAEPNVDAGAAKVRVRLTVTGPAAIYMPYAGRP